MTDDTKPFPKHRPAPLPIPCPQCAAKMTVEAEDKPPGVDFIGFCSHEGVLLHAHVGQNGAIVCWNLVGPLTEEQALSTLAETIGTDKASQAFGRHGELVN